MQLPTQIAAGAAFLSGACVLAHFFYVAIKAPEAMSLGFASEFPRSLSSRVYLGLVVVSWVAFALSGAYGLLSWLPGDGARLLTVLVAFLSLGLLAQIERWAYTQRAYRSALRVRRELEHLIEFATIPSQSTIDIYREKARSSGSASDREAYAELAELATALANRDKQLQAVAVSQFQREAAGQAKAQQTANKTAEAAAAKLTQRARLRQVLDANVAKLPVTGTLDLVTSESLLDSAAAKLKWKVLCDFAERLRGLSAGSPIPPLLQALTGVQPIPGVVFELVLEGNKRDGHCDVFSIRDGIQSSILDGIAFEPSFDGMLAAFFLSAALPCHLAWGHGFYDRDQEFVLSQDRVIAIFEDSRISADNAGLQVLTVPPGFRVCRAEGGALTMKCLTYRPDRGFYEYAVSVAAGCASTVQEIKIFLWGQGVLY